MDTVSKKKRSEIMGKIKSKWTSIEKETHNQLKGLRIKHKMHPKITGNPDILLKKTNIVIFLDGDFWHGKNLKDKKKMPKTNKKFWQKKINANINRDKKWNRKLRKMGMKVLRFWETDIKKNPKAVMRKIQDSLACFPDAADRALAIGWLDSKNF